MKEQHKKHQKSEEKPAKAAEVVNKATKPHPRSEETSSIPNSEINELRKKAAESDKLLDQYQRAVADYQNLRKRIDRDVVARSEELMLEMIQEIIVILDHLDLALLSAENGSKESLKEGVNLIRSQLETLLARQGIQSISTKGAEFDPKLHEAILQEPQLDVKPGTILEELRKGYRWKDRVVRPSQVKIATEGKSPTETPGPEKPSSARSEGN